MFDLQASILEADGDCDAAAALRARSRTFRLAELAELVERHQAAGSGALSAETGHA